MRWLSLVIGLIGCALPGMSQSMDVSPAQTRYEREITFGDTLVAVYHYGPAVDKPYFHPIRLAGGAIPNQAITYDAPADHIHHRGLSFGWPDISGKDFWSEVNSPEGQRGIILTDSVDTTVTRQAVTLTARNRWMASTENDEALFRSVEEWTFHKPVGSMQAIDVRFTATAAVPEMMFGSNPDGPVPYHGLCMRIGPFNDPVFLNGEGEGSGSELRGQPSPWCALRGTQFGRPIQVVILDHPENDVHPTPFAVYDGGMQFISTSPNHFEPNILNEGDTWTLRYRIVASEEWLPAEDLWKAYAETGQ